MPLIPLIPPLIIPLIPPLKSNGSPSGVNQFDSRHRPSTALATWQEGRGAGGGGFGGIGGAAAGSGGGGGYGHYPSMQPRAEVHTAGRVYGHNGHNGPLGDGNGSPLSSPSPSSSSDLMVTVLSWLCEALVCWALISQVR